MASAYPTVAALHPTRSCSREEAGRKVRARLGLRGIVAILISLPASAQTARTWPQVRDQFQASNPSLRAARLGVEESRAQEITAGLRPNPEINVSTDGNQLTSTNGVWQPFSGTQFLTGFSYLHEREHKRQLRLDSARQATAVAEASYSDQQRGLLFNLRSAFVQILAAKATLQNAQENLNYWGREIELNRKRFDAGDLARIDLNRLQLQRVQFEADLQSALTNLRTAKIQLLTLLNDRTPIDQFDVTGPYDFSEALPLLQEFRDTALAARPDLKAAVQSVELAKVNHRLAAANGSMDPTFTTWWTHNPSINNPNANNTLGVGINIPIRIFDRNQGERARTQIDIGRNEELRDATQAAVLSDVDSAYWTLVQALNLLKPYKETYLPLAEDNRNRISIAFRNGGASLLDFLDAEKAYRDTHLAYLNLIGSYLTAAAQMNLAVGREILQ